MKKFAEMSAAERQKWLSQEAESGMIDSQLAKFSVVERVSAALAENGPMTTAELAEVLHYRKATSLGSWANFKGNREKMEAAGIIRHVSPDDGVSRIWLLESHLRIEDEPAKEHRPALYSAMRSSSG